MGSSQSTLSPKPVQFNSGAQRCASGTDQSEMDATWLAEDLNELNVSNRNEINILLLGETGAGKSTFINSIVNYLEYREFEKAETSPFNILITSSFPFDDINKETHTVIAEAKHAKNKNEDLETGVSHTQAVHTYRFSLADGTSVCLIDTPGMGDTRGIDKDNDNCEHVLSYLSNLQYLHAICYISKTQQSRSTIYFDYCVTQILSRLEVSACKNIIFIFTHSKGSNYSAGETLLLLKRLAEDIKKRSPHVEIPVVGNSFCFDNEAFRTLCAIKQGVEIDPAVRKWSIESWNRSTEECWRMIKYINNLEPHYVQNTSAVNEARRAIYQLSQPMADIAQLINDNIQILDRHKGHLDVDNRSLAEMQKKLYLPVIELVVKELTQPVTVCTDLACSEVNKVGEKKEWHYKTRCHDPCYLDNVPRDIMGSPELINCASMGPDQNCVKCTHSYKVHMHVYYMTEKKEIKQKDANVEKTIHEKEHVIKNAKEIIKQVEVKKEKLETELQKIVSCNAKFAHFLQKNAIASFSDSYAEYIRYQIQRERRLGDDQDKKRLESLQRLLDEHAEQKKCFKNAADLLSRKGQADPVNAISIHSSIQELFNLELNGVKIKQLYNAQKRSLKKEYDRTVEEYKHEAVFQEESRPKQTEENPSAKLERSNSDDRGERNQSSDPPLRNQENQYESLRSCQAESRSFDQQPHSGCTNPAEHHNIPPPRYTECPYAHPRYYTMDAHWGNYPSREYRDYPPREWYPPRELYLPREGYLSRGYDFPREEAYRRNADSSRIADPFRDTYPSRQEYVTRDLSRDSLPPREGRPSEIQSPPPRYADLPRNAYPSRDTYPTREEDLSRDLPSDSLTPKEGCPQIVPSPPPRYADLSRNEYPSRDTYPSREYLPRDPYLPRDSFFPREGCLPRFPSPPREGYLLRYANLPHDAYPPRDTYRPRDPYYLPRDSYYHREGYPPERSYPTRHEYPPREQYPPHDGRPYQPADPYPGSYTRDPGYGPLGQPTRSQYENHSNQPSEPQQAERDAENQPKDKRNSDPGYKTANEGDGNESDQTVASEK